MSFLGQINDTINKVSPIDKFVNTNVRGVFKNPGPVTGQSLSTEQQQTLGSLADFFKGQVGNTQYGDAITSVLQGTNPALQRTASNYYNNALLGPSMQEFERVTRPEITNKFAGAGGSLSSRRGLAVSDAFTGMLNKDQDQFASFYPQLQKQFLDAISAQAQAALSPAEQTSQFALSPTYSAFEHNTSGSQAAAGLAGSAASFLPLLLA